MTDAEKREFLEREGCKPDKDFGWDLVILPDGNAAWFTFAHKLMRGKKTSRERARLRKAGCLWVNGNTWICPCGACGTRQEAVAYLDKMEAECVEAAK